jgi:hypothetical protein
MDRARTSECNAVLVHVAQKKFRGKIDRQTQRRENLTAAAKNLIRHNAAAVP